MRKLKRYAPLALAGILLAVTAAFILHTLFDKVDASSNEYFGNVEQIYHAGASLPITDLEGDTDVVTITSIRPTIGRVAGTTADTLMLNITFAVPSGDRLHMTSRQYTLDGTVGDASIYNCGTVERLDENGEWALVGRVKPNAYPIIGKESYPTVSDGSREDIAFPLHDPGKYRITYNFRRIVPHWIFVTSDELYTLSHTITVPEVSDKKFDVVYASLSSSKNSAGISILLRANDDEKPYLYTRRTNLEMLKDGKWVSAPANEAFDSAVEAYVAGRRNGVSYTSQSRRMEPATFFSHPFEGHLETDYFHVSASLDIADPTAQYRLTFDFRDTPTGSGKSYPLTIYFDIPEG